MIKLTKLAALVAVLFVCASCSKAPTPSPQPAQSGDHGHAHGDGDDHAHGEHDNEQESDDHDHTNMATLGAIEIGGLKIEASQGHGKVEPGKEGYLAVKLPYNDKGATVIRAWIGVEDRTLSEVGKSHYARQADSY